jgi:S-DNA-T family DNA segregation ATPase FtsK/SpoIIIE
MARHKTKWNQDKEFKIPKLKLHLSAETKRGTAVVIFAALALITFLSSINLAGSLGQFILNSLKWIFGLLAYFIPILFLLVVVLLAKQKIYRDEKAKKEDREIPGFYWRIYLGAFLMAGSIAGLVHIFYLTSGEEILNLASQGKGGGYLGAIFGGPAYKFLDFWAGSALLFALLIIGLLVAFDVPLSKLWPKKQAQEGLAVNLSRPDLAVKINTPSSQGFVTGKVLTKNKRLPTEELEEEGMEGVDQSVGSAQIVKTKTIHPMRSGQAVQLELKTIDERKSWKLPTFDLLDDSRTEVDSGNIELNVAVIKKTLADFGIEVEMGEVNVGPTVTQYTLRPAVGVKLSQIGALQNDLALALAAHSIRMELPIPGRSLVGIEVPNKASAVVRLREVMQTREFVDHRSKLAFALGRDVAGHPMVTDLAKMPHLLIAGATGTGKSVAINSLFVSLLYRNTPQEVKFIVIDPKRVELILYNGIPHLLTPVVIDHEKAVNALKWAVAEMDRRYKLLAEANKRNIVEYNSAFELRLPYIIILVDELADLMAVAQGDVEAAIVRLAQMARAVGVHLVVATQRPSVDIITGLIKANITSRMAFAVASQVDSRTILDMAGAEKLLGNGDMLFVTAEFNKPKRIQGAFVGEKEVKRVVDFFKAQTGAVIYNEEILEKPKKPLSMLGFENGEGWEEDPLLDEAMEEVKRAGKASASLLQRRLRIGYARAARLLDILEERGVIGPGEGAKPREIYGVSMREDDRDFEEEEIDH